MLSCIFYNYGFTLFLALCLAISEWLGGNKKIKENSIYQVLNSFLKYSLNKKNN
jgi:hypothetical protein